MLDQYRSILCFCPAGRQLLATLVLSTWTDVQRFVLTDQRQPDEGRFDAALVMDEFVDRRLVESLAASTPVIVLAWNGLFELRAYRERLRGIENISYVGTDERLDWVGLDAPYSPMINRSCSFLIWRQLAGSKTRFEARGDAKYQLRWLRARAGRHQGYSALVSAVGAAVRRPGTLVGVVRAATTKDKLVWAGNCYWAPTEFGLPAADADGFRRKSNVLGAASSPRTILSAGGELLSCWEDIARRMPAETAHQYQYVANTIVRWMSLRYLAQVAGPQTCFYGSDNVGLGLQHELDVYHVAGRRRMAYLDFGGKTSSNPLYPRSLHLLARECYVLPLSTGPAAVAEIQAIGAAASGAHFFDRLEARRRSLYRHVGASESLATTQSRVWRDFMTNEP